VITENRLEIEIKIKVESLDPLRHRIRLLPAVLAAERGFERNVVFDTDQKLLQKRGLLLRLRQQGTQTILTMKAPVQGDSIYKVREETEVQVSDFANMEKIILGIGFREYFVYEKFREVYEALGVHIMVDETPIGNYIEIEGRPAKIDAVAARLGFTAADYISDSYYRLFLKSGRSGHMVFSA